MEPITSGNQSCPYCLSEIPMNAKKCRYCGEWVEKQDNTFTSTQSDLCSTNNAENNLASEVNIDIPCKICGKGHLVHQRIHRMSVPVVAIGYILLIPSILLIFVFLLNILNDTKSITSVSAQFEGCGMVLSFVSGLLGWLLIMKKDVLKCNLCGAVVAKN